MTHVVIYFGDLCLYKYTKKLEKRKKTKKIKKEIQSKNWKGWKNNIYIGENMKNAPKNYRRLVGEGQNIQGWKNW
jgi:hypothetical protein